MSAITRQHAFKIRQVIAGLCIDGCGRTVAVKRVRCRMVRLSRCAICLAKQRRDRK